MIYRLCRQLLCANGVNLGELLHPKPHLSSFNRNPRTIVWSGTYTRQDVVVKYRESTNWEREQQARVNLDNQDCLLPILATLEIPTEHKILNFQIEPFAPPIDVLTMNSKFFLLSYGVAIEGMRAIHNNGFVHTDIAPRNVFFNQKAMLGDFDLAHAIGDNIDFSSRSEVPFDYLGTQRGVATEALDRYLFCANIPLNGLSKLPRDFQQNIQRFVARGCHNSPNHRYSSLDSLSDAYFSLVSQLK